MKKLYKPIGVYVMTIIDFLFFGLVPLIGVVWTAQITSESEIPYWAIVVKICLSIFTMGAAVWAWTGENIGRWVLLTVVTFNLSWIILNCSLNAFGENIETSIRITCFSWIIRSCFWLIVNWSYFNKMDVRDYYKQNS